MSMDLTLLAGVSTSHDVTSLMRVLELIPKGYAVQLRADDAITVVDFRVEVDHAVKVVYLTSWEPVR